MTDKWTEADDAVEEVREIRRRIWARFDNDAERVIDYYLELDRPRNGPSSEVPGRSKKGKSAA